ncbi:Flp family type IVb pilin [Sphingomonas lacunae]|uniref:Flp family type IVb pilin n=1 Tax=Sphingomonas lacunae TaxID=2698828 RepID=A0A6M4AY12_9SPHN|nr:Flp family type IVb pilin [Sphingomonas lacunae]QJQ33666.1 Flp family type IVb pilin [Sphingomonas lacunae]
MSILKSLFRNAKGATAIEYGLIAALIAVACITAMDALGSGVAGSFDNASTSL